MKTLKAFTFSIIALIFGCQPSEDNFLVPVLDNAVYTTKGTPTLISSSAYFNSVYKVSASFRVVENPLHGKVSMLLGDDYFYYEPDPQSMHDEDEFTAEMISPKGERLALATFRISSVNGCERGPMVTYVKIKNHEPFSMNLLDNDLFCNLNVKNSALYLRNPINVAGDFSIGGAPITFYYTPNVTQFPFVSEFIYEMGLNPNPENSEWTQGYKFYHHPEIFEKYASVRLIVEVEP